MPPPSAPPIERKLRRFSPSHEPLARWLCPKIESIGGFPIRKCGIAGGSGRGTRAHRHPFLPAIVSVGIYRFKHEAELTGVGGGVGSRVGPSDAVFRRPTRGLYRRSS